MQWLIDIIKKWALSQDFATKAWVLGKNYLTTVYIDRGDPAAYDFLTGDFIRDGEIHDLDLSDIIPAGIHTVHFSVILQSTLADRWLWFRKKGNVNPYNRTFLRTQVAKTDLGFSDIIEADAAGKIEYCCKDVSINKIEFLVRGWFL